MTKTPPQMPTQNDKLQGAERPSPFFARKVGNRKLVVSTGVRAGAREQNEKHG
jgi:hypothetical protein